MPASVIVVTDDEQPVLQYITVILRSYDVHAFSSPEQALAYVEGLSECPVMLITDVVMPHLSGPDLAVACQKRFPKLPVLLISGYAPKPADMRRKSWRFLAKPFRPNELRAAVQELLVSHK